MQIYLAVTPAEAQEASRFRCSLAHVAYCIGPDSTLLRQNLLLQTRGGLLSVTDRGAPFIASPERLSAAALRECGRRSYGGVLLDFEQPPAPDRLAFAETLARRLSPRPVYVPESYAAASGAIPLICTAISGGNFVQRLQEAAAGRDRAGGLALDVQRLRMDFTLPAQSGEGRPLSGRELQDLLDRESPSVFFSQDLCARYFTYARDGETHFVLFDDADTLSQKLRTGSLTDSDWDAVVEGVGIIGNAKLVIDDTPGISIMELRSKCRKIKLEHGLDIVMIDYLQLMTGSGKTSDNRQQEISEISRSLKALARELNAPVIALSQLSRACETRTDHRPMLSDLRESGAIEQDADVVMFLYRDDYYNKDTDTPNVAEVIIAKQRNGPIGTVNLGWRPELTRFVNMARE